MFSLFSFATVERKALFAWTELSWVCRTTSVTFMGCDPDNQASTELVASSYFPNHKAQQERIAVMKQILNRQRKLSQCHTPWESQFKQEPLKYAKPL